MIRYGVFRGKLNEKTIKDFMEKLDYSVQTILERQNVVIDTLYDDNGNLDEFFVEYFNQDENERIYFKVNVNKNDELSEDNFICKQLEKIANYILFCDESKRENRKSSHPFLTSYKSSSIAKNEVGTDNIKDGDTEEDFDVCNFKKVGKIKITKQDMVDIKILKELEEAVKYYEQARDRWMIPIRISLFIQT
jgi:hypothetical protein